MKVSDINWTRGVTRIYILMVVTWFLYWVIWVPLVGVHEWQEMAMRTDDKAKHMECLSNANIVAQWRELSKEVLESPITAIIVLFLPPLLCYGALRLILVIIKWIARGFRPIHTK